MRGKEQQEIKLSSKDSNIQQFVKDQGLISALHKKGISNLLPIQYSTYAFIQNRQDVIAKDRTGSGKTIAYALPIVQRLRKQNKRNNKPRFLILLPTRQLAIQVTEQIKSIQLQDQLRLSVVPIYGGNQIQGQIQQVRAGADIIVATPGRMIDMLQRRAIDVSEIKIICLDEADEMLNIGFKQAIQKIFHFITQSNKVKIQTLMFSATLPDWIWKMSELYQSKQTKYVDMIRDSNVKTSKTVQHWCLYMQDRQKQNYIGSVMNKFYEGGKGKTIVFCQTKREVEKIGECGLIPVKGAMLHGDFPQYIRQKVFHGFKNGTVQCLIATNVAARGLDFPQIDLIIQLEPPTKTDQYIHRSGRTGRVGKEGFCVTMYSDRQIYYMERIQKEANIKFLHINPKELTPFRKSKTPTYKSYNDWREDNLMQQQIGGSMQRNPHMSSNKPEY